jgi:hypothetical protein
MWPYAAVFALLAFGAFTAGPLRPQLAKPHLILLSAIILTLFIGLRVQVGGDWYVYQRIYNHCASLDLWSAIDVKTTDPAYGLVNWLAAQFGAGLWAVNLLCAAIFVYGLWSFCRMQTNPPLAVLVAYPYVIVVVAMGYTRQSVALGLIMAAIPEYQKGRILRVVVLLIIAAAFHKSAVVVAPLFAIAETHGRWKTFVIVGITAALSYVLFLKHSLNDLIDSYIIAKYNSGGALIRVAMNLVAAAVFLIYRKRIPFRPKEYRLWLIFSLAVVFTAIAYVYSPSSTAVDRIGLYLLPLQITILSRFTDIYREQNGTKLLLVTSVVCYSFAVGLTWLLVGNTSWAWIPYRNYLWLPAHFAPTYHHN